MSRDDLVIGAEHPETGVAGLRVLVADDTFITQAMMMTRLKKLGCIVTVVDNGRLAVEAVKNQLFDCVFMDYHMPILDGVEATRQIRQWESGQRQARAFIVAFTATSQPADRVMMTAAGMDDFLSKPMSVEELLGVLRRAAGRKEQLPG